MSDERDYDNMNVEDLRELAEQRGLSKSGRKDDLVARLELADEEDLNGDSDQPDGGTIPPGPGLDAESTGAGAATSVQPTQGSSDDAAQAGDPSEESDSPDGETGPSPAPTFQRFGVATGRPAQMDPDRQDESVRGIVTDERGTVLTSPSDE